MKLWAKKSLLKIHLAVDKKIERKKEKKKEKINKERKKEKKKNLHKKFQSFAIYHVFFLSVTTSNTVNTGQLRSITVN